MTSLPPGLSAEPIIPSTSPGSPKCSMLLCEITTSKHRASVSSYATRNSVLPSSPRRPALARACSIARRSRSTPTTRRAPPCASASACRPLPHPKSSTSRSLTISSNRGTKRRRPASDSSSSSSSSRCSSAPTLAGSRDSASSSLSAIPMRAPEKRRSELGSKHASGRAIGRYSEQRREGVDDQPGQAADERAVDADELQVAPDRELDAARGGVGVPAVHRLRYQARDLVLVALEQHERDLQHPVVDLLHQRLVGQHGTAERRQRALDRLGRVPVGLLGVAHERVLRVAPER